jgi:hypothetical protein
MWRWAGRCAISHSPGEVIDTKDLDALNKIVERSVSIAGSGAALLKV